MSRRRIAVAFAVALGALALVAWLVWPRDQTTRATVGEAVRSFRSERGHADRQPGEPPFGVYRYATRGGEEADSILNANHDYSGVSTITLSAGRCGERERWQVFEERWSEAEACAGPDGLELAQVAESHEFFGIQQEDAFSCRGPAGVQPSKLRPRAHFEDSCQSDDTTLRTSSRLLGREKVMVGGHGYMAAHILGRARLQGATSGVSVRQDWRRLSDGLLLRRVVGGSTESGTAGGTDYHEHYRLHLLDAQPQR